MRKILALPVMALCAISVAANAAPVKLSKEKMATVTAGALTEPTKPNGNTNGCQTNPNCAVYTPNGKNTPPGAQ
ncbi:hypothetical protein [Azospirillum soli]|uniref:hypothetical protein n=1 Tax=Azospirillum soli TaxID=1304799 RepID=UPI001AE47F81|nr:hypothetical protein [Azospirillum soli]MBP2315626.1 hypothetical protein [Azospirillum soli]